MVPWWRRGVSLIVLFVLAGAPAVAAACAELCDPRAGDSASTHHAAAAAHHEAGMADCHDAQAGSEATVLTSTPCDHHDDVGIDAAFLTASREDTRMLLAQPRVLTATLVTGATDLLATGGASPHPTPPRPTAAPLALRI